MANTALCVLVTAFLQASPEAISLERSAFEYRLAILSGQVRLTSRVVTERGGVEHTRATLRVAYFDGDKLRVDEQTPYSGLQPPGTSSTTYWERKSFTDAGLLTYTDQKDPSGRPYQISIADPQAIQSPVQKMVLDARALGLFASGSFSLGLLELQPTLQRPDVTVVGLTEAEYKGELCRRIDYVRRDDCRGSVWIDPKRGPSIVRALVECPHPTNSISEEIECELTQHTESGYWFPTHIDYFYRQNQRVTQREELDIEVVSLGAPMPPETFTFEGLGLEPGREVAPIGFPNPVQRIWTGKELVPMDTIDPRGPSSVSWPWVLGWMAVVAGVILLIVVYRRRVAT